MRLQDVQLQAARHLAGRPKLAKALRAQQQNRIVTLRQRRSLHSDIKPKPILHRNVLVGHALSKQHLLNRELITKERSNNADSLRLVEGSSPKLRLGKA